jgi:hypothetical protein
MLRYPITSSSTPRSCRWENSSNKGYSPKQTTNCHGEHIYLVAMLRPGALIQSNSTENPQHNEQHQIMVKSDNMSPQ